jgi:exopolysaccharide biosynthesis polyprenyl glycosylphosphotransferase
LQAGPGQIARALAVLFAALLPQVLLTGPAGVSLESSLRYAALGALAIRVPYQIWLWLSLRNGSCLQRVMVLAESGAAARFLAAAIERRSAGQLRVAASGALPGMPGAPAIGWIEDAVSRCLIDRVLLAGTAPMQAPCLAVYDQLRASGIDAALLAARPQAGTFWPAASSAHQAEDGAQWLAGPLSRNEAVIKRLLDIAVAGAALLFLAPALLAIALAIKIDSPGPVIFRQQRTGLHGKAFRMWKFRSMYTHLQDSASRRQTSRNDERVTRVGRLLRRSSLDELPQLFNVVRGDMSLVGPRPHALGMTVAGHALHDLAQGYDERHQMKPGITGWAQVNGCRGEVDEARKLRRRVALDCYYIENWSLAIDISILFRTAALLFVDRHAY